jgi:D-alanyl-D-alanine carboxypeptidase/D-alanyl-D-alanine-endopeptidase (penicillin-binding protein 4)
VAPKFSESCRLTAITWKNPPGRVGAKTGTLNGVTALSGYVPSADGERLAFSLMMEFYTGSSAPWRAVQDSIVAALARFRR